MKITQNVLARIKDSIGKYTPECGGVLGASKDGTISEYYFDTEGTSTPNSYIPNVAMINDVLINEWKPRDIVMVGIVHSHANGVDTPSCVDVDYGIRILQALDTVDQFYLPIVTVVNDVFRMTCFSVVKVADGQCTCRKIDFEVVDS